MKRTPLWILLPCLLLTASCRSSDPAALSASHAEAIEDSVRSYLESWTVGHGERGWDRLALRYADTPGFVWVEDGRIRYGSVSAIREAVAGLESRFSSERTEFIDPAVTPLAPGLAHVAARFRTTLGREGEPAVVYGGALTMTLGHTDTGWAALQGHTSTAPRDGRAERSGEVEAPGSED